MKAQDPYYKLRPILPTPADEICSCKDEPPLVLRSVLSSNPIGCARCNLEMPPERLELSRELAEGAAYWQMFFDCFYNLWLDSGEYEEWAKTELSRPDSPVNQRGLALCRELNMVRRSYYLWFQEVGDEAFEPASTCPVCGQPLTEAEGRHVCERCAIMMFN